MSVAFVAGDGNTGMYAARQLAATPGFDRIILAAPGRRARPSVDDGNDSIEALDWTVASALPPGVDIVISASSARTGAAMVNAAIEAGVDAVVGAGDAHGVRSLLDLAPVASAAGSRVVVGAGLAPGLSEVLASYGAGTLDRVTDVHVARYRPAPGENGRAPKGPWSTAFEIRAGAPVTVRSGLGRRMVPFPPPIGLADARTIPTAVPLLMARILPGVEHVTSRQAIGRARRRNTRNGARGVGAIHVEIRGTRGSSSEILTFGVVDQLAAATGAVLAAAAAVLHGHAPGTTPPGPGVMGLAETAPARALLLELRRQGVRAARFDRR